MRKVMRPVLLGLLAVALVLVGVGLERRRLQHRKAELQAIGQIVEVVRLGYQGSSRPESAVVMAELGLHELAKRGQVKDAPERLARLVEAMPEEGGLRSFTRFVIALTHAETGRADRAADELEAIIRDNAARAGGRRGSPGAAADEVSLGGPRVPAARDRTVRLAAGRVEVGVSAQGLDLEALRARGVSGVVRLGPPIEGEMERARGLGLPLQVFSCGRPSELSPALLDRLLPLLHPAGPTLLVASSGDLAGAAWLAHRVLDGGLRYERALAEARLVGLADPAWEAPARAYIEAVVLGGSREAR